MDAFTLDTSISVAGVLGESIGQAITLTLVILFFVRY